MFKLVKIIGSGTNQPEPIRIPTGPSVSYKANCAYTIIDGFLADLTEDTPPTHIAIETVAADSKDTILCYRILDNMIFEVPVKGSFSSLHAGQKFKIDIDSEGSGIGITSVQGGFITIYDTNNAQKNGDTTYVCVEK